MITISAAVFFLVLGLGMSNYEADLEVNVVLVNLNDKSMLRQPDSFRPFFIGTVALMEWDILSANVRSVLSST